MLRVHAAPHAGFTAREHRHAIAARLQVGDERPTDEATAASYENACHILVFTLTSAATPVSSHLAPRLNGDTSV
jgi:hypothetical protein